MTPAEHRENAERLMSAASFYTADPAKDKDSRSLVAEAALLTAQAQVHATLALAPPPPEQPPQRKWDLTKPQMFPDATGGFLTLTPVPDGLIFNFEDTALLMEHPAVLRTIASHLTAHADRLESKP